MATRWGIVSCGKISHDFVTAIRSIKEGEHKIIAVAARDTESAKKFAQLHNIPKFYGSYKELSQDKDVEVVYVGCIHPYHLAVSELMLSEGKHLLVEKPLTMNVKQTKQLVHLAKDKKLFLMEAVWSRFLPAYENLMDRLKEGEIGEVKDAHVTFGVPISTVARMAQKELGGGATLDIGVYCLNAITMVMGGENPLKVAAVGHLNSNGVDEKLSCSLSYSGGRVASFIADATIDLPCELEVFGTKGNIKLGYPMWCSTSVSSGGKTSDFPLPSTVLPTNYVNSSGLRYEAIEVRRCIQAGLTESPRMSLDDSLLLADLMEQCRKQVGVVYPQDEA